MYFVFILLEILPFIIVPVVIISIVLRARKNGNNGSSNQQSDKASTPFKNTISNANDEKGYWNSISSEDSSVYCDYCGSKMLRAKKRCSSCGARVQKEDKN